MKKLYIVLTAFLLASSISFTALAQEEDDKTTASDSSYSAFGLDIGVGMSLGLFDSESPFFYGLSSEKADREYFAGLAILYSFRINIFIDFRFTFLGILSMGVETGLNWLSYDAKDNGTNYSSTIYWFDIPFRGFVRVGIPSIYVQASGGYYLGLLPIWTHLSAHVLERGPEVGGRVNIFGFYIEAFYIFSELNPHMRAGLGYTAKIF